MVEHEHQWSDWFPVADAGLKHTHVIWVRQCLADPDCEGIELDSERKGEKP